MKLVYRFNYKSNSKLIELCKISKNLYNQALYCVKQELDTNKKWLFYNDLNKLLKNKENLEGQVNYKLLKAQVSQQCLRLLEKNIKSYIKAVKDWSKNKQKYKAKPNFPKYKHGLNCLIYTNQCCNIKNGFIKLSKDLYIKIPQYDKYQEKLKQFQQVRIIPMLDKSFTVEIIYEHDCKNEKLDYTKCASIDLGINNLITLLLPDEKPLLFNGRSIKAKNQFFNKTVAKLKSKLTNNCKSSKQIRKLYTQRENQINDKFHKVSKYIVNLLVDKGIGNIVVGYNRGWKDSIRTGHRNNQTFVSVPYLKLISYIQYKCQLVGIKVITNEESYTSKCDGLALEAIDKHETYAGKRTKRGLFQSSVGKLINADVNGALNILRKVIGDSVQITQIINSGWLFQPVRTNVV